MTLDLSIGLNAPWGSAALPQLETGADELLLAADRAVEVGELRELAAAPATAGVVGDIAPPVVLDYGALPPEVNSGRMYAGPGAGSLLAAACAWDSLAAELHVTAAGYDSAISELTGIWWFGPAAESMVTAVLPFASWLSATASVAEQAGIQARAAAAAYEMAFALTVPPPVIASNRALLAALIATNWFGQNSAAIAATELHYAEMWAQDAGAISRTNGSDNQPTTATPNTHRNLLADRNVNHSKNLAVAQSAADELRICAGQRVCLHHGTISSQPPTQPTTARTSCEFTVL